jgi:ubiquinone/menaquinone biosynthesis C-methylase UbiE/predicted transcriptional regulator
LTLIQVYKALADESRLRLLRVLLHGAFNVNELQEILQMGQSRVSRHLKLLLEAGLAQVRRQGTWAYYEVAEANSDVTTVQLDLLRQAGEHVTGTAQDEQRRKLCLDQRRERSRVFHDRVATKWSRLRKELLGNGAVLEQVVTPIGNARVVADLGCGAGELLSELARSAGKVIGVDSSTAMLDQARSSLAETGMAERVELRLGALEHLPLADGEADAALMNMVLHHLADPPSVLSEVKRAIGPGGTLVVCDLARHEQEWMRETYGDQWLGFTEEEIGRFFSKAGIGLVSIRQYDAPRAAILVAVGQA